MVSGSAGAAGPGHQLPPAPPAAPADPVYAVVEVLAAYRHSLTPDVLRSLADIWVCASAARWGEPYETWWLDLADPEVAALYSEHDVAGCEADDGQAAPG
jgi:hypothetical protein